VSCLFRKIKNVFVGALLPFLHINFLALLKVALNASQYCEEDVIIKVLMDDFADLTLTDFTLLEGKSGILNNGTHLLRQLRLHCIVNLRVDLFLLFLVGCNSLFLVFLCPLLHAVFHFLDFFLKLFGNFFHLIFRFPLTLTGAIVQLALNVFYDILEVAFFIALFSQRFNQPTWTII